MKRTLYFLIVLTSICCSLSADDIKEDQIDIHDQKFLFVSLGSICRTADILRQCELRTCAFPFDWIISTDGEKLIEILDTDFRGFITNEVPFLDESISLSRGGLTLLHPYYHLEFTHESAKNEIGMYFVDWQKFHSKFQRRIDRFRQLEHFKGKVFFIRTSWYDCTVDPYLSYRCYENIDISDEYALKLFEALKRRFPVLDFSLIIQNHSYGRGIVVKKITENVWMVRNNPDPLSEFFYEALSELKEWYQELLEYSDLVKRKCKCSNQ